MPRCFEIGTMLLKEKSLKIRLCIFTISLLSPLKQTRGPSIAQTCIPYNQKYFMPSLVEVGLVLLEKRRNENNNEADGKSIHFNQKSSLEPSAQMSLKCISRSL